MLWLAIEGIRGGMGQLSVKIRACVLEGSLSTGRNRNACFHLCFYVTVYKMYDFHPKQKKRFDNKLQNTIFRMTPHWSYCALFVYCYTLRYKKTILCHPWIFLWLCAEILLECCPVFSTPHTSLWTPCNSHFTLCRGGGEWGSERWGCDEREAEVFSAV